MFDETSVDTLASQRSLLADRERTTRYLQAILATVKPGDIVLDIGSGTGILALMACLAGAKLVYAVEQGPLVELAEEACRRNGYEERVIFLNDWSTNVEIPGSIDVIVTETIGNAGFDEGILGWVIDARKRFLKPSGKIIPQSLSLMAAPVEMPSDYTEVDGWSRPFYTFDLSAARAKAARNLWSAEVSSVHLLARSGTVTRVDLGDVVETEFSGEISVSVRREGTVHGLGCWFVAELTSEVRLSNEPAGTAASWHQVFLPLEEPLAVAQGDTLEALIQGRENGALWEWRVSRGGELHGGAARHSSSDGRLGEKAEAHNRERSTDA